LQNSGGMVMGICNGFQILVETGLVPGVLLRNKYLDLFVKMCLLEINNKAKYLTLKILINKF
jgi:phosphoribosylformylglycinamidine synthase